MNVAIIRIAETLRAVREESTQLNERDTVDEITRRLANILPLVDAECDVDAFRALAAYEEMI